MNLEHDKKLIIPGTDVEILCPEFNCNQLSALTGRYPVFLDLIRQKDLDPGEGIPLETIMAIVYEMKLPNEFLAIIAMKKTDKFWEDKLIEANKDIFGRIPLSWLGETNPDNPKRLRAGPLLRNFLTNNESWVKPCELLINSFVSGNLMRMFSDIKGTLTGIGTSLTGLHSLFSAEAVSSTLKDLGKKFQSSEQSQSSPPTSPETLTKPPKSEVPEKAAKPKTPHNLGQQKSSQHSTKKLKKKL